MQLTFVPAFLQTSTIFLISISEVKNSVGRNPTIRGHSRSIYALLAATILLSALSSMMGQEARANPQAQTQPEPAASEPRVIQGRIAAIEGAIVTVKTPEGFPGARGGHAQYVTAGPTFRIDISRARVLLPDGRQPDKVPLAVGDRVLVVLIGPDSGPQGPGSLNRTYFASVIERLVASDKIVTH